MPGRSLPSPFDAAVAAGEIRADQFDPDYLYFLQHVRPDGNSYVLDLPARGDSPPVTLKYETKTPHDGEAQIACALSPVRAKSDRRAEEENPSADTPWYGLDANIDPDYSEWLRNTRAVDGHLVFELGSEVVHYHDCKEDEAWPVVCSKAGGEEEAQGDVAAEVAAVAASGEDGVREEEKVVALISTDGPVSVLHVAGSRVRDCRALGQKVEDDQEKKDEGKYGAGEDEEVGLDESMAVASEPDVCDRPEQKIRGEKLLNVLAVKTPNTLKGETNSSNDALALPDNRKPQLRRSARLIPCLPENDHKSDCLLLGLHGVVWPTHIIERPESGFKERLMHVLRKPFSQDEYDTMLGKANIRSPVTKERRTRRGVKYYRSKHEKNKSYFDNFPDLAEQVEGTSYPNRLALLRGFFFWLENVGHEDQFRPWRDDFTHYKVIFSLE